MKVCKLLDYIAVQIGIRENEMVSPSGNIVELALLEGLNLVKWDEGGKLRTTSSVIANIYHPTCTTTKKIIPKDT